MIHIEKLSLKNVGKYTWQTFIDNFIGTKETRTHILEKRRPNLARAYINSQIITSNVLPKLKGIALGKYFGMNGVDINELLTTSLNIENLVIEISVDNINSLPKNKLKTLLESYPVILNDFEEGGNLYHNENLNLIKLLIDQNIKPKQLFLVGSGLQMRDYPQLNIYKIYYDYWLVICATIREHILDNKQSLLDNISSYTPPNFCIVPTFKPRIHRLKILSYLDSINILDKCTWSMGYNHSNAVDRYQLSNNGQHLGNTEIMNQINLFLSNHTFPKSLPNAPYGTWESVVLHDMSIFNQYRYYLVAETYIGDELLSPLGGCGIVTEKTYKCFLTAAAPIIYGPPEMSRHLNTLGFKTLTEHLDISDYRSVGNFLNELSLTQTHEKDLIQHNFDLVTNKDFLADQVAAPLNKIAELINSVRR